MPGILFIFSLLVSLLLCGCSSEPELLPTIRLGHAPHDHHAALYVTAQLPDHFRQQGNLFLREVEYKQRYQLVDQGKVIANVVVSSGTGGGQLIRKLHEKQVDLVLGGVPAMIQQIDAGSELKIVAPVMSEGAALVLGRDYPVADWASFVAWVKQAEKPPRIGYKTATSVQNLIFEQALQAEGIRFSSEQATSDTQLIVLNLHGAKNLIPALTNGLVDGFVIMQPFAALAEYQQVGKSIVQLRDLPPDQLWHDHPCCALAANGPLLYQHSEALTRLVTLLLRGNRYLQQHPQESSSLIAKWLEKPLAVEELSLSTINYLVDYPANWHQGIDHWLDLMEQRGELTGTLKAASGNGKSKSLLYDMDIYATAREQVE